MTGHRQQDTQTLTLLVLMFSDINHRTISDSNSIVSLFWGGEGQTTHSHTLCIRDGGGGGVQLEVEQHAETDNRNKQNTCRIHLVHKKGEGRSLLTHFRLEPVTLQTLGARGPHVVRGGKAVILFSPNNFEQLLVSGRGLVLC